MNSPKISIITVVYNGAKSIEKTIHSVLNQTYKNIEYIIIDGGSTDNTIDIIKKYEGQFFYWVSEPDKGIYDAMNKGLDAASGEWINFMNCGDSFFNNEVLSNFIKRGIQGYPQKSFFYSDFYVENGSGGKTYYEADHHKGNILHQSVIYRKNLHQRHGYYIVTEKIIVSDYLFFVSINTLDTEKLDFPISTNEYAGISSGKWCKRQKLCIDYVFYKISLSSLIWKLSYPGNHVFKNLIKRILGNRISKMIINFKHSLNM